MRVLVGGRWELEGTTREIVQQMKDMAEGVEEMPLLEYIDWVAERALVFEGITIQVSGRDERSRATSLVNSLILTGLAQVLDEDDDERTALESSVA